MVAFWTGVAVMAAVGLLILFLEEKRSGFAGPSIADRLRAERASQAVEKAAKAAERTAREAAQVAAAKRQKERSAFKAKQDFLKSVGEDNAVLIDSARVAVHKVNRSEAAREGWLGDVDFTADVQAITDSFRKAQALRKTAGELSVLSNPSPDDRRIMDEAVTAAANLELAATERVELIGKCATEAQLIDQSLSMERQEARTAEQRAQLHGKLSELLYGIEAAPDAVSGSLAADSVMARVQAYREIKNQIQRARDGLVG
jgi:hypothetical protein